MFERARYKVANAIFKTEKAETLPQGDTAWSDKSVMYSLKDFEKYNPDLLIGTKGFGIYKKMMIDEQVKAVTHFKRDAITSREYFFKLDHEKYGISEAEAKHRIELSNEIVDQLEGSFVDVLNNIMTASYNGFSMNEKIFGQIEFDNKTWWGIKRIKIKPFDTFLFKVDEYGNNYKTIQKITGEEQEVNIEKFIKYIVNPDTDEHYGGSELRAAYRAWFSKDMTIKFRNMWLERHASGFRWFQAKEGKSITAGSAEYVALQNALTSIQSSTGMILPNSVTMDSEYPENNVAFKEAIEDNDTAIARAMLVPNLLGVSPQGKHGSNSQATSQLDAFLWTLEANSTRLEETLNEQLFRQLAKVNFGDDAWPRIKFKPISDTKTLELINTWADLIQKGAVGRTDTDDKHIRELLEFPEAGEAIKDDSKEQGLNSPNSDPDNTDINNEDGVDTKPKKKKEEPLEDDEEMTVDSTIIGKGSISIAAFSKAQRRVDFAVMAKTSESVVDEFTTATADVMDSVFSDLISKAKQGGKLDEKVKDNLKELKVDNKLKKKLNRTQTAMLKEARSIGRKHAEFEVDKAKKENYSRGIDSSRLNFIAEDYFKMKAFKITGNFTDSAIKMIETEILNGTKYDKTWAEVEKAIYTSAASNGLISIEQAKDALGEALGVANPDARIRTVIRTSSWDAINEARHSYFTDPSLDGFVVAFEYSSILDDRTTSICKHLDEENRGNHSEQWYKDNPQFRPPNHYNCRSLLIPVTEEDVDSYVEGGEPTMQPQGGFK